jgi:hypothetical protein
VLTTTAYLIALATYALAALVALVVAYRTWLSPLSIYPARMVTGLLLGLLLVPAQPSAGAETLAPALVIAIFNTVFGEGWATARQAVVLLGIAGILGALFGAITAFISARGADRYRSQADAGPGVVAEPQSLIE